MMKSIRLFVIFISFSLALQAQKTKTIRFDIGFGTTILNDTPGATIALEPKYIINKKMHIGFRFATAGLKKSNLQENDFISVDAERLGNVSYFGTFDYYLGSKRFFAPYIGFGCGLVQPGDIYEEENLLSGLFKVSDIGFSSLKASITPEQEFGVMVRGGFEFGKFKFGVEYNFVPKSTIRVPVTGEKIGEATNSYASASLALVIGGGKRK